MEENKKRLMETINRNFEEGGNPIIVVFEMPPEFGMRYCVLVDGKEIERMRSFEMNVKNFTEPGIQEAPFYRAEQYLPLLTYRQMPESNEKRRPE